jgi:hypothetical protein
VATKILNVGVNMRYLAALCRADGMGSGIAATQIPGRTARRIHEAPDSKLVGRVYDYLDQFNTGCAGKAKKREKIYAKHGWIQIQPGKTSPTERLPLFEGRS